MFILTVFCLVFLQSAYLQIILIFPVMLKHFETAQNMPAGTICHMLDAQTCPPHNAKPPWMLRLSRPLHLTVGLSDLGILLVGLGVGLETLKTSIWSRSVRCRKFFPGSDQKSSVSSVLTVSPQQDGRSPGAQDTNMDPHFYRSNRSLR